MSRLASAVLAAFLLGVGPCGDEIGRGLQSMLERQLAVTLLTGDARIVLGTADSLGRALPQIVIPSLRSSGAFWVGMAAGRIVIAGKDERGVLYGTFALLRRVAMHEPIDGLNDHQEP